LRVPAVCAIDTAKEAKARKILGAPKNATAQNVHQAVASLAFFHSCFRVFGFFESMYVFSYRMRVPKWQKYS